MSGPQTPINQKIFLQRLKEIVQQNLSNDKFGVVDLVREIGVSRSKLHENVRRLLHKTINEYIREIRLIEAMKLLKDEGYTAAEIAYKVGFSSPTYFNKCFHDHYGYPPGEVKKLNIAGKLGDRLDDDDKLSIEKSKDQKRSDVVQARKKSRRKAIGMIVFVLVVVIGIVYLLNNLLFLRQFPDEAEIEKSIAVLPFKDDSQNKDNEYFCNGLMESVINHLVKIRDLNVLSRTSVEPYRNTSKNRKEIANELNVANILEGSVFKVGNRFKISVQLINAKSGYHLWSEAYEVDYTEEIFDIHSNIAQRVASALKAEITPIEENRITRIPTAEIKAYEFYIKGQYEYQNYFKLSPRHKSYLKRVLDLLDRALEIDPNYADALVLKGRTFSLITNAGDSTIYYANRALSIDPECTGAYILKGWYYDRRGKPNLAILNYLKVIDLTPNNFWPYSRIGEVYISKNDVIKGFTYFQKAIDIGDHQSKPSLFFSIGTSFYKLGDYEKAIEYYQKMSDLDLNCNGIYYYSNALIVQSKFKDALNFLDVINRKQSCLELNIILKFQIHALQQEYERAEFYYHQLIEFGGKLWPQDSIRLILIYKALGRDEEAYIISNSRRKALENRLVEEPNRFIYYNLSRLYAIMDEREKALKYLSHVHEFEGNPWNQDFIEIDPSFENLRDEPEFKAIVKQAHDEKTALRKMVREMQEKGEIDL